MPVQVVRAVALSAIIFSSGFAVASSSERQTIRFTSPHPGAVVVPVDIGSVGGLRFLLDTGSSHSAVTPALFARLGAAPIAKTTVASAAGAVPVFVVSLSNVAIGEARAVTIQATVLPQDSAAVIGEDINGIIGQDFLSRFNYTIDYRHSRIDWNTNADDAGGVRLPLVASGDRFLIELRQSMGDHGWSLRFVPDSAADAIVLFDGTNGRRLFTADPARSARLDGLAGHATVRVGVLENLRVGDTRLTRAAAALISRSDREDGDGLLPLHLFASVSFNHREGYAVIRPR